MPRLPVHEACKRCGDDLTGFLRAIGVCGRCMQTPVRPTSVPRPLYGWTQAPRVAQDAVLQAVLAHERRVPWYTLLPVPEEDARG